MSEEGEGGGEKERGGERRGEREREGQGRINKTNGILFRNNRIETQSRPLFVLHLRAGCGANKRTIAVQIRGA